MSPEAQRVAIAEFCKLPPEVTWKLPSSMVVDNEDRFLLPDFTNDLNACAAMEKCIPSDRRYAYPTILAGLVLGMDSTAAYEEMPYRQGQLYAIIMATAAQRCEAFLKTINLWKE